jgi:Cys-tRNA(Pro)/Cys-tRNA(Cys) deacylase
MLYSVSTLEYVDAECSPGLCMIVTRQTKFLDHNVISYRVLFHDKPVFTVEDAVIARGVDAREMVKSILLKEKNGSRYVMACVAGPDRLIPQAVRGQLEGWKRLTFASAEEITEVTGYIKGAVSPLCLPDNLPVFIDKVLANCEKVNISSGDPSAELELSSADLIFLSKAIIASITAT